MDNFKLPSLKEASYFIDKHKTGYTGWVHTGSTGDLQHKAANENGNLLSKDCKQLASSPGRHESVAQSSSEQQT